MSDIFYLCSALDCPEEPNYIVMLKNGGSGMAFLCRWHLMELRNGAPELVVVSKRIEPRSALVDPGALSELFKGLR
jgi:hypothetical protein